MSQDRQRPVPMRGPRDAAAAIAIAVVGLALFAWAVYNLI